MGTQTQEDWNIQVTIKHGPKDDRGVPVNMTNIRGYTARDISDLAEGLGEYSDKIQEGITGFLAKDTIKQSFPEAKAIDSRAERDDRRDGGGSSFKNRDGEICGPHQLPMKWKQIKSKKDGKWYELLECTSRSNPCDTTWDN